MGYSYKNIKGAPIEKSKPKNKEIRRIYSVLADEYLHSNTKYVIYIDELACNSNLFQKRRMSANK